MTPSTPQVARDKAPAAGAAAGLRGKFVWYELLATDRNAATAFYPKVLGWETQPFETPPGSPPYTIWATGGKGFGGLMDLPEEARKMGAPTHWLGYIGVPDVDASVAQAQKLGAKVLMGPLDLPNVGRLAVVQDPQGAVIALFKPGVAGGAPPPAGIVSWHELATDDGAKAWDFYEQMFGWEKGQGMDMGEMGIYQIFNQNGQPLGAMYQRPPMIPVSNWLYYFRVPDLDAAVGKTTANGGKVLNGPMDVPGGRIAQCMDPQGAAFALHWIKQG